MEENQKSKLRDSYIGDSSRGERKRRQILDGQNLKGKRDFDAAESSRNEHINETVDVLVMCEHMYSSLTIEMTRLQWPSELALSGLFRDYPDDPCSTATDGLTGYLTGSSAALRFFSPFSPQDEAYQEETFETLQ